MPFPNYPQNDSIPNLDHNSFGQPQENSKKRDSTKTVGDNTFVASVNQNVNDSTSFNPPPETKVKGNFSSDSSNKINFKNIEYVPPIADQENVISSLRNAQEEFEKVYKQIATLNVKEENKVGSVHINIQDLDRQITEVRSLAENSLWPLTQIYIGQFWSSLSTYIPFVDSQKARADQELRLAIAQMAGLDVSNGWLISAEIASGTVAFGAPFLLIHPLGVIAAELTVGLTAAYKAGKETGIETKIEALRKLAESGDVEAQRAYNAFKLLDDYTNMTKEDALEEVYKMYAIEKISSLQGSTADDYRKMREKLDEIDTDAAIARGASTLVNGFIETAIGLLQMRLLKVAKAAKYMKIPFKTLSEISQISSPAIRRLYTRMAPEYMADAIAGGVGRISSFGNMFSDISKTKFWRYTTATANTMLDVALPWRFIERKVLPEATSTIGIIGRSAAAEFFEESIQSIWDSIIREYFSVKAVNDFVTAVSNDERLSELISEDVKNKIQNMEKSFFNIAFDVITSKDVLANAALEGFIGAVTGGLIAGGRLFYNNAIMMKALRKQSYNQLMNIISSLDPLDPGDAASNFVIGMSPWITDKRNITKILENIDREIGKLEAKGKIQKEMSEYLQEFKENVRNIYTKLQENPDFREKLSQINEEKDDEIKAILAANLVAKHVFEIRMSQIAENLKISSFIGREELVKAFNDLLNPDEIVNKIKKNGISKFLKENNLVNIPKEDKNLVEFIGALQTFVNLFGSLKGYAGEQGFKLYKDIKNNLIDLVEKIEEGQDNINPQEVYKLSEKIINDIKSFSNALIAKFSSDALVSEISKEAKDTLVNLTTRLIELIDDIRSVISSKYENNINSARIIQELTVAMTLSQMVMEILNGNVSESIKLNLSPEGDFSSKIKSIYPHLSKIIYDSNMLFKYTTLYKIVHERDTAKDFKQATDESAVVRDSFNLLYTSYYLGMYYLGELVYNKSGKLLKYPLFSFLLRIIRGKFVSDLLDSIKKAAEESVKTGLPLNIKEIIIGVIEKHLEDDATMKKSFIDILEVKSLNEAKAKDEFYDAKLLLFYIGYRKEMTLEQIKTMIDNNYILVDSRLSTLKPIEKVDLIEYINMIENIESEKYEKIHQIIHATQILYNAITGKGNYKYLHESIQSVFGAFSSTSDNLERAARTLERYKASKEIVDNVISFLKYVKSISNKETLSKDDHNDYEERKRKILTTIQVLIDKGNKDLAALVSEMVMICDEIYEIRKEISAIIDIANIQFYKKKGIWSSRYISNLKKFRWLKEVVSNEFIESLEERHASLNNVLTYETGNQLIKEIGAGDMSQHVLEIHIHSRIAIARFNNLLNVLSAFTGVRELLFDKANIEELIENGKKSLSDLKNELIKIKENYSGSIVEHKDQRSKFIDEIFAIEFSSEEDLATIYSKKLLQDLQKETLQNAVFSEFDLGQITRSLYIFFSTRSIMDLKNVFLNFINIHLKAANKGKSLYNKENLLNRKTDLKEDLVNILSMYFDDNVSKYLANMIESILYETKEGTSFGVFANQFKKEIKSITGKDINVHGLLMEFIKGIVRKSTLSGHITEIKNEKLMLTRTDSLLQQKQNYVLSIMMFQMLVNYIFGGKHLHNATYDFFSTIFETDVEEKIKEHFRLSVADLIVNNDINQIIENSEFFKEHFGDKDRKNKFSDYITSKLFEIKEISDSLSIDDNNPSSKIESIYKLIRVINENPQKIVGELLNLIKQDLDQKGINSDEMAKVENFLESLKNNLGAFANDFLSTIVRNRATHLTGFVDNSNVLINRLNYVFEMINYFDRNIERINNKIQSYNNVAYNMKSLSRLNEVGDFGCASVHVVDNVMLEIDEFGDVLISVMHRREPTEDKYEIHAGLISKTHIDNLNKETSVYGKMVFLLRLIYGIGYKRNQIEALFGIKIPSELSKEPIKTSDDTNEVVESLTAYTLYLYALITTEIRSILEKNNKSIDLKSLLEKLRENEYIKSILNANASKLNNIKLDEKIISEYGLNKKAIMYALSTSSENVKKAIIDISHAIYGLTLEGIVPRQLISKVKIDGRTERHLLGYSVFNAMHYLMNYIPSKITSTMIADIEYESLIGPIYQRYLLAKANSISIKNNTLISGYLASKPIGKDESLITENKDLQEIERTDFYRLFSLYDRKYSSFSDNQLLSLDNDLFDKAYDLLISGSGLNYLVVIPKYTDILIANKEFPLVHFDYNQLMNWFKTKPYIATDGRYVIFTKRNKVLPKTFVKVDYNKFKKDLKDFLSSRIFKERTADEIESVIEIFDYIAINNSSLLKEDGKIDDTSFQYVQSVFSGKIFRSISSLLAIEDDLDIKADVISGLFVTVLDIISEMRIAYTSAYTNKQNEASAVLNAFKQDILLLLRMIIGLQKAISPIDQIDIRLVSVIERLTDNSIESFAKTLDEISEMFLSISSRMTQLVGKEIDEAKKSGSNVVKSVQNVKKAIEEMLIEMSGIEIGETLRAISISEYGNDVTIAKLSGHEATARFIDEHVTFRFSDSFGKREKYEFLNSLKKLLFSTTVRSAINEVSELKIGAKKTIIIYDDNVSRIISSDETGQKDNDSKKIIRYAIHIVRTDSNKVSITISAIKTFSEIFKKSFKDEEDRLLELSLTFSINIDTQEIYGPGTSLIGGSPMNLLEFDVYDSFYGSEDYKGEKFVTSFDNISDAISINKNIEKIQRAYMKNALSLNIKHDGVFSKSIELIKEKPNTPSSMMISTFTTPILVSSQGNINAINYYVKHQENQLLKEITISPQKIEKESLRKIEKAEINDKDAKDLINALKFYKSESYINSLKIALDKVYKEVTRNKPLSKKDIELIGKELRSFLGNADKKQAFIDMYKEMSEIIRKGYSAGHTELEEQLDAYLKKLGNAHLSYGFMLMYLFERSYMLYSISATLESLDENILRKAKDKEKSLIDLRKEIIITKKAAIQSIINIALTFLEFQWANKDNGIPFSVELIKTIIEVFSSDKDAISMLSGPDIIVARLSDHKNALEVIQKHEDWKLAKYIDKENINKEVLELILDNIINISMAPTSEQRETFLISQLFYNVLRKDNLAIYIGIFGKSLPHAYLIPGSKKYDIDHITAIELLKVVDERIIKRAVDNYSVVNFISTNEYRSIVRDLNPSSPIETRFIFNIMSISHMSRLLGATFTDMLIGIVGAHSNPKLDLKEINKNLNKLFEALKKNKNKLLKRIPKGVNKNRIDAIFKVFDEMGGFLEKLEDLKEISRHVKENINRKNQLMLVDNLLSSLDSVIKELSKGDEDSYFKNTMFYKVLKDFLFSLSYWHQNILMAKSNDDFMYHFNNIRNLVNALYNFVDDVSMMIKRVYISYPTKVDTNMNPYENDFQRIALKQMLRYAGEESYDQKAKNVLNQIIRLAMYSLKDRDSYYNKNAFFFTTRENFGDLSFLYSKPSSDEDKQKMVKLKAGVVKFLIEFINNAIHTPNFRNMNLAEIQVDLKNEKHLSSLFDEVFVGSEKKQIPGEDVAVASIILMLSANYGYKFVKDNSKEYGIENKLDSIVSDLKKRGAIYNLTINALRKLIKKSFLFTGTNFDETGRVQTGFGTGSTYFPGRIKILQLPYTNIGTVEEFIPTVNITVFETTQSFLRKLEKIENVKREAINNDNIITVAHLISRELGPSIVGKVRVLTKREISNTDLLVETIKSVLYPIKKKNREKLIQLMRVLTTILKEKHSKHINQLYELFRRYGIFDNLKEEDLEIAIGRILDGFGEFLDNIVKNGKEEDFNVIKLIAISLGIIEVSSLSVEEIESLIKYTLEYKEKTFEEEQTKEEKKEEAKEEKDVKEEEIKKEEEKKTEEEEKDIIKEKKEDETTKKEEEVATKKEESPKETIEKTIVSDNISEAIRAHLNKEIKLNIRGREYKINYQVEGLIKTLTFGSLPTLLRARNNFISDSDERFYNQYLTRNYEYSKTHYHINNPPNGIEFLVYISNRGGTGLYPKFEDFMKTIKGKTEHQAVNFILHYADILFEYIFAPKISETIWSIYSKALKELEEIDKSVQDIKEKRIKLRNRIRKIVSEHVSTSVYLIGWVNNGYIADLIFNIIESNNVYLKFDDGELKIFEKIDNEEIELSIDVVALIENPNTKEKEWKIVNVNNITNMIRVAYMTQMLRSIERINSLPYPMIKQNYAIIRGLSDKVKNADRIQRSIAAYYKSRIQFDKSNESEVSVFKDNIVQRIFGLSEIENQDFKINNQLKEIYKNAEEEINKKISEIIYELLKDNPSISQEVSEKILINLENKSAYYKQTYFKQKESYVEKYNQLLDLMKKLSSGEQDKNNIAQAIELALEVNLIDELYKVISDELLLIPNGIRSSYEKISDLEKLFNRKKIIRSLSENNSEKSLNLSDDLVAMRIINGTTRFAEGLAELFPHLFIHDGSKTAFNIAEKSTQNYNIKMVYAKAKDYIGRIHELIEYSIEIDDYSAALEKLITFDFINAAVHIAMSNIIFSSIYDVKDELSDKVDRALEASYEFLKEVAYAFNKANQENTKYIQKEIVKHFIDLLTNNNTKEKWLNFIKTLGDSVIIYEMYIDDKIDSEKSAYINFKNLYNDFLIKTLQDILYNMGSEEVIDAILDYMEGNIDINQKGNMVNEIKTGISHSTNLQNTIDNDEFEKFERSVFEILKSVQKQANLSVFSPENAIGNIVTNLIAKNIEIPLAKRELQAYLGGRGERTILITPFEDVLLRLFPGIFGSGIFTKALEIELPSIFTEISTVKDPLASVLIDEIINHRSQIKRLIDVLSRKEVKEKPIDENKKINIAYDIFSVAKLEIGNAYQMNDENIVRNTNNWIISNITDKSKSNDEKALEIVSNFSNNIDYYIDRNPSALVKSVLELKNALSFAFINELEKAASKYPDSFSSVIVNIVGNFVKAAKSLSPHLSDDVNVQNLHKKLITMQPNSLKKINDLDRDFFYLWYKAISSPDGMIYINNLISRAIEMTVGHYRVELKYAVESVINIAATKYFVVNGSKKYENMGNLSTIKGAIAMLYNLHHAISFINMVSSKQDIANQNKSEELEQITLFVSSDDFLGVIKEIVSITKDVVYNRIENAIAKYRINIDSISKDLKDIIDIWVQDENIESKVKVLHEFYKTTDSLSAALLKSYVLILYETGQIAKDVADGIIETVQEIPEDTFMALVGKSGIPNAYGDSHIKLVEMKRQFNEIEAEVAFNLFLNHGEDIIPMMNNIDYVKQLPKLIIATQLSMQTNKVYNLAGTTATDQKGASIGYIQKIRDTFNIKSKKYNISDVVGSIDVFASYALRKVFKDVKNDLENNNLTLDGVDLYQFQVYLLYKLAEQGKITLDPAIKNIAEKAIKANDFDKKYGGIIDASLNKQYGPNNISLYDLFDSVLKYLSDVCVDGALDKIISTHFNNLIYSSAYRYASEDDIQKIKVDILFNINTAISISSNILGHALDANSDMLAKSLAIQLLKASYFINTEVDIMTYEKYSAAVFNTKNLKNFKDKILDQINMLEEKRDVLSFLGKENELKTLSFIIDTIMYEKRNKLYPLKVSMNYLDENRSVKQVKTALQLLSHESSSETYANTYRVYDQHREHLNKMRHKLSTNEQENKEKIIIGSEQSAIKIGGSLGDNIEFNSVVLGVLIPYYPDNNQTEFPMQGLNYGLQKLLAMYPYDYELRTLLTRVFLMLRHNQNFVNEYLARYGGLKIFPTNTFNMFIQSPNELLITQTLIDVNNPVSGLTSALFTGGINTGQHVYPGQGVPGHGDPSVTNQLGKKGGVNTQVKGIVVGHTGKDQDGDAYYIIAYSNGYVYLDLIKLKNAKNEDIKDLLIKIKLRDVNINDIQYEIGIYPIVSSEYGLIDDQLSIDIIKEMALGKFVGDQNKIKHIVKITDMAIHNVMFLREKIKEEISTIKQLDANSIIQLPKYLKSSFESIEKIDNYFVNVGKKTNLKRFVARYLFSSHFIPAILQSEKISDQTKKTFLENIAQRISGINQEEDVVNILVEEIENIISQNNISDNEKLEIRNIIVDQMILFSNNTLDALYKDLCVVLTQIITSASGVGSVASVGVLEPESEKNSLLRNLPDNSRKIGNKELYLRSLPPDIIDEISKKGIGAATYFKTFIVNFMEAISNKHINLDFYNFTNIKVDGKNLRLYLYFTSMDSENLTYIENIALDAKKYIGHRVIPIQAIHSYIALYFLLRGSGMDHNTALEKTNIIASYNLFRDIVTVLNLSNTAKEKITQFVGTTSNVKEIIMALKDVFDKYGEKILKEIEANKYGSIAFENIKRALNRAEKIGANISEIETKKFETIQDISEEQEAQLIALATISSIAGNDIFMISTFFAGKGNNDPISSFDAVSSAFAGMNLISRYMDKIVMANTIEELLKKYRIPVSKMGIELINAIVRTENIPRTNNGKISQYLSLDQVQNNLIHYAIAKLNLDPVKNKKEIEKIARAIGEKNRQISAAFSLVLYVKSIEDRIFYELIENIRDAMKTDYIEKEDKIMLKRLEKLLIEAKEIGNSLLQKTQTIDEGSYLSFYNGIKRLYNLSKSIDKFLSKWFDHVIENSDQNTTVNIQSATNEKMNNMRQEKGVIDLLVNKNGKLFEVIQNIIDILTYLKMMSKESKAIQSDINTNIFTRLGATIHHALMSDLGFAFFSKDRLAQDQIDTSDLRNSMIEFYHKYLQQESMINMIDALVMLDKFDLDMFNHILSMMTLPGLIQEKENIIKLSQKSADQLKIIDSIEKATSLRIMYKKLFLEDIEVKKKKIFEEEKEFYIAAHVKLPSGAAKFDILKILVDDVGKINTVASRSIYVTDPNEITLFISNIFSVDNTGRLSKLWEKEDEC